MMDEKQKHLHFQQVTFCSKGCGCEQQRVYRKRFPSIGMVCLLCLCFASFQWQWCGYWTTWQYLFSCQCVVCVVYSYLLLSFALDEERKWSATNWLYRFWKGKICDRVRHYAKTWHPWLVLYNYNGIHD